MVGLAVVGLAAFGLGIWLGLPGRGPTVEDVERTMRHPLRASRKVRRHFTLLDWARPRPGGGPRQRITR